jgi:hypothetical protein
VLQAPFHVVSVFGANENKISYAYRARASIGVEVVLSWKVWSEQRVGVSCIAWLDGWQDMLVDHASV